MSFPSRTPRVSRPRRGVAGVVTGAAKARLEEEIKFMTGVPAAAPEERPHVTFQLRAQHFPTGAQATYVYRVHVRTPEVRALFCQAGAGQ